MWSSYVSYLMHFANVFILYSSRLDVSIVIWKTAQLVTVVLELLQPYTVLLFWNILLLRWVFSTICSFILRIFLAAYQKFVCLHFRNYAGKYGRLTAKVPRHKTTWMKKLKGCLINNVYFCINAIAITFNMFFHNIISTSCNLFLGWSKSYVCLRTVIDSSLVLDSRLESLGV